jgi:hypothetical protein
MLKLQCVKQNSKMMAERRKCMKAKGQQYELSYIVFKRGIIRNLSM